MEHVLEGEFGEELALAAQALSSLVERSREAVVGQGAMVEALALALVSGGHALIEGLPGLAKTLAAKAIARASGLECRRVQFTPDLLPSDLTGSLVLDRATGRLVPRRGPVFSGVLVADEINRAPAKVQAALLEAMEEGQVTMGEESLPLPDPFFVVATRNPAELEGTYPLPEAELDRFAVMVRVDYPSEEEEGRIVSARGFSGREDLPAPILDQARIRAARAALPLLRLDPRLQAYAVALVRATRPNDELRRRGPSELSLVERGASPRASIQLCRLARARALCRGRAFCLPEDVKAVAPLVLAHRLSLGYEADAKGLGAEDVVRALLDFVPVP
jgi:MoxR-like ATPase